MNLYWKEAVQCLNAKLNRYAQLWAVTEVPHFSQEDDEGMKEEEDTERKRLRLRDIFLEKETLNVAWLQMEDNRQPSVRVNDVLQRHSLALHSMSCEK